MNEDIREQFRGLMRLSKTQRKSIRSEKRLSKDTKEIARQATMSRGYEKIMSIIDRAITK